ncbi:tRNA uridine-5-carboxymethylaminomethyl(34) synthesis GTPase MnmE [Albimonas pacifica]|uniref:tRNA modification GTPase MnmE n=1 Tax=Albimonas pacifica TaxID=1114924 RepID=A0A1I3FNN6_9RHOB|nr:tRNA uridine-5-carboxymethylaminomethyl(34) synthesis GTPase MnmE [Albimonas pacifica]SFI12888.1 tRNA modification GTPase trmE [Albimonas pacifica]
MPPVPPPRDTIFAPATGRGRAAIAVIRVSGPAADAALLSLAGDLPEPRRAVLRDLSCGGELLDQALVIRFAAGASFTGEDTFEIQGHGGPATVSALLNALGALPGLRLAEPGEFTRRALEAGRIDLLEAEGLADLVGAETEAQRRQALRSMRGALGDAAAGWRKRLIRARALVEAVMDFADEEVPTDVTPEVSALIASVSAEIAEALAGAAAAERIRDGFEVALIGAPNAGKSTLLNALARRDAALTSEIAGTTRDVIEVHMDLAGLPVTLLDTAGLRETQDPVEAMGVARARRRAEDADLRIFLQAPGGEGPPGDLLQPDDLLVASKSDLPGAPVRADLRISAATGDGVEVLTAAIGDRLAERAAGASSVVRARHRRALEEGATHLSAAARWLARGEEALDVAAEELRLSTRALEILLGRVDAERVLDDIFAEFCLGK